jgi:hypothetical protein
LLWELKQKSARNSILDCMWLSNDLINTYSLSAD